MHTYSYTLSTMQTHSTSHKLPLTRCKHTHTFNCRTYYVFCRMELHDWIHWFTDVSLCRQVQYEVYTDIQDVVISKFVSSAERGHASSDTLDIHTQRNVSATLTHTSLQVNTSLLSLQKTWHEAMFHGEWKGRSAGGSVNNRDTFLHNQQVCMYPHPTPHNTSHHLH